MAQTQWDSFQELKENISMSDLLAHYGLLASLNPRRDGEKPYGVCLAIGSCLDSRPISGPQIFAALKSTLIGKGVPVPVSRVLCLNEDQGIIIAGYDVHLAPLAAVVGLHNLIASVAKVLLGQPFTARA